MPTVVSSFRPTSKIKNGKNGLSNTAATKSHVAIRGENLDNGQTVNVYFPKGSTTLLWTGPTSGKNAQGTACHAKLDYVGPAVPGPRDVQDDPTTVGVTVGDSNPQQPFNVNVGPVLDGTYNVRCDGVGIGGYKWFNPNGTTGVNLANSNPPTWTFEHISNEAGNCYKIQITISNVVYSLAWINDGSTGTTVSLVTTLDGATTWQLDNNCIRAFPSASAPICPFLNGDTATGAVTMVAEANPSESTSWSLGTFGLPL